MGCDIHCYVEHRRVGRDRWSPFGGRNNPGRDYAMFAVMAGVRSYGDDASNLFEPRGMPTDPSFYASADDALYVSDSTPDEEGCCSRDNAERWVKSGSSRWLDDNKTRVSHPDWHSHSWVTLDEYVQCIEARKKAHPNSALDDEYYGILGAMAAMEQRGCETRIVFWFDN